MTELVVVDAAELRAIVTAAVRDALGAAPSDAPIALRDTGQPIRVLRRAIRDGELAAVRVGREYRVAPSALAAWLATRTVEPRPVATTPSGSAVDRAIGRARRAGALRVVGGPR